MPHGARPRRRVGANRCGVDGAAVVEGGRLRGGVVVVTPARGVRSTPGRRGRHRLGLRRSRPEPDGSEDAGKQNYSHAIHGSFSRKGPVALTLRSISRRPPPCSSELSSRSVASTRQVRERVRENSLEGVR
jgi:hypothetical protein